MTAGILPNRAAAGLTLLMISAVAAPVTLASGVSGCLLLTALVCASWTLHLSVRGRVGLDDSRVVAAVATLMAVAVLSFLVGQYPWFPVPHAPMRAQVGGLSLFLLSGGVFLAVAHEVRSLSLLKRLTWTFLLFGGLLLGVLFLPTGPLTAAADRVMGLESVGSAFWTWLVAISVSQALFNRRLSPITRIGFLAIGSMALVRGLVLNYAWVSGWLPPLVAVGVVFILRFPRTMIGLAMLAIAPVMFAGQTAIAASLTGESYSWTSRLEAWRLVWEMIQTNPWLGFGPANYHHYTVLFPIWGWWVQFSSHNNYLDLVAQTGFIGLIAFCWFALEALRLGLKLRARVPSGFARAYVAGALGGLAGVLVSGMLADWIIPFAYNVGMKGFRSSILSWVFLGGLVSLRRMLIAQSAESNRRSETARADLILAGV